MPRHLPPAVAALACVALAGCFRDEAPALECTAGPIGPCEAPTTGADSTTGEPATTVEPTTGAPVVPGRAFRIDTLAIVDPAFFLEPCSDATEAINTFVLQDNVTKGKFNLLIDFPSFDPEAPAPALVEADECDVAARTCLRKDGLSVTVSAERVESGSCVDLDPAVLAVPNAPLLHQPQPPCVRTDPAALALPIEGAPVPLALREAQVAFHFDSPEEPEALEQGVVYGFLTRASAEATVLDINGAQFGLWEMIVGPEACMGMFPEYLPSIETLVDGDREIEGVWLVFNFTAVRVELTDPA